ncbi:MAG: C45 family autoproteolytic acyltransferase/hydrolase [Promethearchaeota archaeon]
MSLEVKNGITYIKIKGTPKERGLQQGQLLREHIDRALKMLFASKMFKSIKPKHTPLFFVKIGLGYLGKKNIEKDLKKYLPEHFEKMKAISKGAKLSQLLNMGLHFFEVLNGHPKVLYRNPPDIAKHYSMDHIPKIPSVPNIGCSMFFAMPPATANNEYYYARNYDFPKILQPFQMVREEIPDDGIRNLTLTQYPLVGAHIGMNDKGLVVGYNYGRAWKWDPLDFRLKGIPGTYILQKVLETCETTEEAVEYVKNFPARSNGFHFGIMDASGNATLVETTATRWAIRKPENGVLVHTNIYVTDKLRDANLPYDVRFSMGDADFSPIESPIRRFKRGYELMIKNLGKIDIAALKSILRDHDNGDPEKEGPDDFSICTHGVAGITLASIIANPKRKEMLITDKQPCMSEYTLFKLQN